jgi:type II restriction enzyme
MSKIQEAREILKALGLPTAQHNEMSGLTLLALCNMKENDNWANVSRKSLGVTKGIMTFVRDFYKKDYAPNTRETFRRQVLHQFEQARLVDYNPDDSSLAVNSLNCY